MFLLLMSPPSSALDLTPRKNGHERAGALRRERPVGRADEQDIASRRRRARAPDDLLRATGADPVEHLRRRVVEGDRGIADKPDLHASHRSRTGIRDRGPDPEPP